MSQSGHCSVISDCRHMTHENLASIKVAFLSFQISSKTLPVITVMTMGLSLTFGFLCTCILSPERTGAPGRGDWPRSHLQSWVGWCSDSHLPDQVGHCPAWRSGEWAEGKGFPLTTGKTAVHLLVNRRHDPRKGGRGLSQSRGRVESTLPSSLHPLLSEAPLCPSP